MENLKKVLAQDIKNVITKLHKSRSKEMDYYLRCDLASLYDILELFDFATKETLTDYVYKRYKKKKCSTAVDQFYANEERLGFPLLHELYQIKKEYTHFFDDIYVAAPYISKEMTEDLCSTFLQQYDPQIGPHFGHLLETHHIHYLDDIKIPDILGCTFLSTCAFDPYIFILENRNLQDSNVMIHEMGHVGQKIYTQTNWKSHFESTDSLYVELFPLFLEEIYLHDSLEKALYPETVTALRKEKIEDIFQQVEMSMGLLMTPCGSVLYQEKIYAHLQCIYGVLLAKILHQEYLKRPNSIQKQFKTFESLHPLDFNNSLTTFGCDLSEKQMVKVLKKEIKELQYENTYRR